MQVSEACEKQLATQHKLAPGLRTDIDATTEGAVHRTLCVCEQQQEHYPVIVVTEAILGLCCM